MKIGDIQISYPYIKYNISIKHFTSRKSTAIEWGILELAKNVINDKIFKDVSLDIIFEQILNISDTDILIKPCINNLISLDAIEVKNFSDATSLKDINVDNIKLTEIGSKLQKEGRLPGKERAEIIELIFDSYNKILISSKKTNMSNIPMGIKVFEIDDENVNIFPKSLIVETLELEKRNKKSKFIWLDQTTEIKDIERLNYNICWSNISKSIEVDENLTIKISGTKINEDVNKILFLDGINTNNDVRIDNFIDLYSNNKEIKNIYLLDNLKKQIDISLNNIIEPNNKKYKTTFLFIDERFVDKSILKKSVDVTVIFNAKEFEVKITKSLINVKIPHDITDEGCILLSGKEALYTGYATLYNNFGSSNFNLIYRKNKFDISERKIISNIVDKHMYENSDILLLAATKGMDVITEKIKDYIYYENSLDKKLSFIIEIKKKIDYVLGKNLDIQSLCRDIIFDSLVNSKKFKSLNDLEETYMNLMTYKKHMTDSMFNNIIDTVVQNIDFITSYSDIKKIKNLMYKDATGKINILSKLYNYNVIVDIYSDFKHLGENKITEITHIEKTYNVLKSCCKNISLYLSGIDLTKILNEKCIVNFIIENKSNIKKIENECRNFVEYSVQLNTQCELEIIENICELDIIFGNLRKIISKIEKFFGDDTIKYNNIVILDTCSLIDFSHHISSISKDTQIIIPSIALQELDNKKNNSDEDLRKKVSRAGNIINNLGNRIIFKNANRELLPEDLEIGNKADNGILSIAIAYIAYEPILVTEDINLRNLAKSQQIKSMNFESFIKFDQQNKNNYFKNRKKDKRF